MPKIPKVPFYKEGRSRIPVKPAANPPSRLDPKTLKRRQEIMKELQIRFADAEKEMNKGEYKKAYKICMSVLKRYTANSILSQEILSRFDLLAQSAIEYMSMQEEMTLPEAVEFFARELLNYKEINVYLVIRDTFIEKVNELMNLFVEKGRESLLKSWLKAISPWITLQDEKEFILSLKKKERASHPKWRVNLPVNFSPGEKQQYLEIRKKIYKMLTSPERKLDIKNIEDKGGTGLKSTSHQALPEPPVPTVKIKKKSSSRGYFSKKKIVADKNQATEIAKRKKPARKKPSAVSKDLKKEDDHLRTHEVKSYLHELKYKQGVTEVHYQKIKLDLGIVSINKARKLFKILQGLEEKNLVIRKKGSIYAILL
ncbi:MAG: hypothetical protein ACTSVI_01215 [Promethearchaeota archaeon]